MVADEKRAKGRSYNSMCTCVVIAHSIWRQISSKDLKFLAHNEVGRKKTKDIICHVAA